MKCSRPKCPNDAAFPRKMCEEHLTYHREYSRKNAESAKARVNARRQVEFEKAIAHYGGKCAECGNDNLLHLMLHHTGFSGKDQRAAGAQGGHFYRWLERQGWPTNVQVLCANCHLAHHRLNGFKGPK